MVMKLVLKEMREKKLWKLRPPQLLEGGGVCVLDSSLCPLRASFHPSLSWSVPWEADLN